MPTELVPRDDTEYVELFHRDEWTAKVADTNNPEAFIEMKAPVDLRTTMSNIAGR